MWNLKYDTNELICKTNRFTDRETNLWLPKGKGTGWEGGEDKLGVWDERIHTTICKIDTEQGPAV